MADGDDIPAPPRLGLDGGEPVRDRGRVVLVVDEQVTRGGGDAGLGGLYLVACLGESDYRDHEGDGFDAGVLFRFPFARTTGAKVHDRLQGRGVVRGPHRYPYEEVPADVPAEFGGRIFPGVYPNWDNTPRSGRGGVVATGVTPERFGAHVRWGLERASALPADQQVLVVKSWNEWAEGNYLEPDREVGTARLAALRAELVRAGHLDR